MTRAARNTADTVAYMESKGIYTDDQVERVRRALEKSDATMALRSPAEQEASVWGIN